MAARTLMTRWGMVPGLALVIVMMSNSGAAAAARLLPLPSVTATSGEYIQKDGRRVVRVPTVLVQRLRGVRGHPKRLTVSCGGCQRLTTPLLKDYPTPTSKLFSGVNYLLGENEGFRVAVGRPGYIGRFVRLVIRRRGSRLRLSFRDSGCLGARRRVQRCPRGSGKVPQGRPVPTAPTVPPETPPGEPDIGPGPDVPFVPPPPPPPPPPPASGRKSCEDGVDNDGDGKIDFPQDPDCSSAADMTERATACSDGLDNDGDGKADFPQDLDCSSPDGIAENLPACSDGVDNDGDGKIDYPMDPQCASLADGAERT